MHILLVEDDANLGMLVQYKLNKEFHNVEWTQDVETAQQYINLGSYDLYILDWMLPSKSGLDFCRELRQKQDKTPILMLTARDAVSDRVEGLNSGADDYLIKPFAFEELLAMLLDEEMKQAGQTKSLSLEIYASISRRTMSSVEKRISYLHAENSSSCPTL